MNLYATRDVEAQGEYFMRHLEAMTAEKLHSKSDIAAELAQRDILLSAVASALNEWVDYFDKLDQHAEPGDRLALARKQFHGPRLERSRAALASMASPPLEHAKG